jgi:hypothetical protein
MNNTNIVIAILTGLVGWLLGEASHRMRELSQDRRAIAKALADLLEIRHQTLGFNAYWSAFTQKFKIPKEAIPVVLGIIQPFMPNMDGLQKRYNEAVDSISSADPMLGFRLRSKDEFPGSLKALRSISSMDQTANLLFQDLEPILLDLAKSPFDDIIIELAKIHGIRTWWRIRKYLRKPLFEQKDFDQVFAKLEPIIAAASQPTPVSGRSGA